MKIGIFTKTFPRPTFRGTLEAVRACGIRYVQLNSIPSAPELALEECGVKAEVLSATFNIIDPHLQRREQGFERFSELAQMARRLRIGVLSVCTGTRDSQGMWIGHPDNDSEDAWREMVDGMARLCVIAQHNDVRIAFEPEQANVVNSAAKARRLLDELKSKHVGVLMDAANLLTVETLPEQEQVLREAFDLVGGDVLAAHAKEFSADGTLGQVGLGKGAVNFKTYVSLLQQLLAPVPLIMHGFEERDAKASLDYLRGFTEPRP